MILCVCPNPSIDMFVWIDTFRSGEVNRAKREQRFPGGKGVHVAMAIAELGEPVHLLGMWGGASGQWIRRECETRGVRCHGPEVAGWSRTCMTFKSASVEFHDTELLGTGPFINSDDFHQLLRDFRRLLPESELVCMSGSWPDGAPVDGYAQLIGLAHDAGKLTVLDTTGVQLTHALERRPGVVHMNRSEAAAWFREDDVVKSARLLADICDYAAVTAGAEGLHLVRGDEAVHARCIVDTVYSAVGSGDCLMAGMAVALQRGQSLEDIARMAVACGGANCMREDLGMLYRKDVEMLLPTVELM